LATATSFSVYSVLALSSVAAHKFDNLFNNWFSTFSMKPIFKTGKKMWVNRVTKAKLKKYRVVRKLENEKSNSVKLRPKEMNQALSAKSFLDNFKKA
jgi:hypothetical protein